MIRAFVFDCFGVFYPDPVFAYMRDPQTPPAKAKALHECDEQAARGNLTKAEFVKKAAALLPCSEAEAEQRFFHRTSNNQPLIDLVLELRTKYKIALLSNIGGDMMDGFFTLEEQEKLFDTVILSGNEKIAKPDSGIFELACKRLGVSLNEAVMIDDVQGNVDTAKSLGMQGICYKDFEQFKSEFDALMASSS